MRRRWRRRRRRRRRRPICQDPGGPCSARCSRRAARVSRSGGGGDGTQDAAAARSPPQRSTAERFESGRQRSPCTDTGHTRGETAPPVCWRPAGRQKSFRTVRIARGFDGRLKPAEKRLKCAPVSAHSSPVPTRQEVSEQRYLVKQQSWSQEGLPPSLLRPLARRVRAGKRAERCARAQGFG